MVSESALVSDVAAVVAHPTLARCDLDPTGASFVELELELKLQLALGEPEQLSQALDLDSEPA